MANEKNFIQIGYTKKTHGLVGELKFAVDEAWLEDFLKTDVIFIEMRGSKTPFFIENVRGSNDFIVKLEEIASKEAAQNLSSKPIFLRETDILNDDERTLQPAENGNFLFCKNFELIDQNMGELGNIQDVISMPAQEMAVLNWQGKQVFVPLVPQFIEKIERRTRRVFVNLPEGLLNL